MELIGILLMLFVCTLSALSQAMSDNAFRYRFYKDRLKYFVYPGTAEGTFVQMTFRNSNGNGGAVLQHNGAEWGQSRKINGYYFGLLATEYKLLMDNEQYADANASLQELNLALDALIRMDKCEDDIPIVVAPNLFKSNKIYVDCTKIKQTNENKNNQKYFRSRHNSLFCDWLQQV